MFIINFVSEVYSEFKSITWLGKSNLLFFLFVVIFVTLLSVLFFATVDYFSLNIIRFLLIDV